MHISQRDAALEYETVIIIWNLLLQYETSPWEDWRGWRDNEVMSHHQTLILWNETSPWEDKGGRETTRWCLIISFNLFLWDTYTHLTPLQIFYKFHHGQSNTGNCITSFLTSKDSHLWHWVIHHINEKIYKSKTTKFQKQKIVREKEKLIK